MNKEQKQQFELAYKKKGRIVDTIMILLWLAPLVVIASLICDYDGILENIHDAYSNTNPINIGAVFAPVLLILMSAYLWILIFIQPLDNWIRRYVVKSYYIEDCGDVIKLHGSVRMMYADTANHDLLSVRPGYKRVPNAFKKYGCTMAAVRASKTDFNEDTGITVAGK